ncbi:MAG: hypothetical protein IKE59_04575 [Erysipelotrichaceae bacterium]|nr:hypothetical protein [Erysipelotrichaceae bacterium]
MKKKVILIVVLLALIAGGAYGIYAFQKEQKRLNMTENFFLAGDRELITVYDENKEEVTLPRGAEVAVKINKEVEWEGAQVKEALIGETLYYIPESVLVATREEAVINTQLYSMRPEVVYQNIGSPVILLSIRENTPLEMTGYQNLREDGSVEYYKVKVNNQEGWLKNDEKHVAYTYTDTSFDNSRYAEYNGTGGNGASVIYYPKDGALAGNEMPEVAKTLYINAEKIEDIDEYLSIGAQTSVNAFVVDIKDTHIISYDSEVVKSYSPSSLAGINSKEEFKAAVQKLNDAGYYTIGRITVFKDSAFAQDHPETAIMNNGELYRYNGDNWPSIFSRLVWEYNVSLAKEAVEEFGFDEIQFDYVRSPEYLPDGVDLRNDYEETRIEAITNFIRYATDVLHECNAYVSIDVFGETSGGYVCSYGQFWPAISNAADVISAMPYPDHFGVGYYGIPEPWKDPYRLMYYWGSAAKQCQDMTYDPAKVRTWIQAYDSIVDGTVYDASMIKAQIDGLSDAGVMDGFITWNGAASWRKFQTYISVLQ